jgi:hypothetical protein
VARRRRPGSSCLAFGDGVSSGGPPCVVALRPLWWGVWHAARPALGTASGDGDSAGGLASMAEDVAARRAATASFRPGSGFGG